MLAAEAIRIFFALIAVLGLIGLLALIIKKAGLASVSGGLVRRRRLAIVETLAIDARRRVAIIKCDDTEHLVVLGATSETIIANNLESPPETEIAATPGENPFIGLAAIAQKLRPAAKDAA